jgi:hypothetical protein
VNFRTNTGNRNELTIVVFNGGREFSIFYSYIPLIKLKVMKNLFNSLGIVMFFKILFKYIKVLNMVLLPFYVFYGFIYSILIIPSFVMWKLPLHIPLPFVGAAWVDRILLLIGLVIGLSYYMEEYKNK